MANRETHLLSRKPTPHHPEADLDYSGPQEGVWWAPHNFDSYSFAPLMGWIIFAQNRYLLPQVLFDALEGGRLDRIPILVRIYESEKAAIHALMAALDKGVPTVTRDAFSPEEDLCLDTSPPSPPPN